MPSAYVYTKFKLKAVIGGHTFEDIVSIGASFGLNTIPTATLTVAVGYEAHSGQTKQATIHKARKTLKARDKAVVTLTLIPSLIGQLNAALGSAAANKMETGEFVIFEGFFVGIGYQRAQNNANYTIQLVHWLDDLNNSSALNGNWFQNAPYCMATNAAFYALTMTGGDDVGVSGGDSEKEWSSVPAIDINNEAITYDNIQEDLWGKVIKPLFNKIADYPLPDDGPNTAAKDALARINETALPLNVSELNPLDIENSVKMALTKESLESFAYTTFWDKLIGEYASQFFFALSPSIEHATVIPFFGGLKFDADAPGAITVYGDEYSYANFNANMQQLIENITVFWPAAGNDMIDIGGDVEGPVDMFQFPSGEYPPEGSSNKRGKKLFKDLPSWLANIVPWSPYSGATTAVKGKCPGDCLAPQTGEENPPPGWSRPRNANKPISEGVAERFAHHWYKTELLGQRFGELSGKLRFDIAPGSVIKIELPETEIESDGFMVAAVTQVSYIINAERAMCGTSLTLSYIRTEEEDGDSLISHPFAPLYQDGTKWHGGSLKKKT